MGETLEAIKPFLTWGVLVFLLIIGGVGLTRISAGYGQAAVPESHPIEIRALLKNKPMPGAYVTFTPILAPKALEGIDDDLSAGLQIVGRAVLNEEGIGAPSLTPDGVGLPAGEYIVSLAWCKVEMKDGETIAGPNRVPQIFRSPVTSTLRVHVQAGENPQVTLNLVDPKTAARRASYDHE